MVNMRYEEKNLLSAYLREDQHLAPAGVLCELQHAHAPRRRGGPVRIPRPQVILRQPAVAHPLPLWIPCPRPIHRHRAHPGRRGRGYRHAHAHTHPSAHGLAFLILILHPYRLPAPALQRLAAPHVPDEDHPLLARDGELAPVLVPRRRETRRHGRTGERPRPVDKRVWQIGVGQRCGVGRRGREGECDERFELEYACR